jgi:serine/threonine protein kinase
MAQIIEMFKNDYLKSSIQKTIDNIQQNNEIKQVKALKTFEDKINEIYEKGCLYKTHYEGIPDNFLFKQIFKIPKHVNPIDIVTLFFPLCFIENTPIEKISRPIILEQIPKKGGGSGSVQVLTKDKRRHIYALNIRELAHYEEFNYGRFVMKIALKKNYSQAYDIEGKVYEGMKKCQNVVKMYRGGKFDKDNNDFWEKDWEDDNMTIDMNKLLDIDLNIDSITLPTNADKYKNMSFLLLENCYNHQTLRNYVRREKDSSGTRSYEAFKKTMKAVQVLNEKVGFFHGDLHTDNVLIREDGEDVKLFDFDFSALLGDNKIISNNLLLYNLTWKPCDVLVNKDCKLFIEKKNEKRTVVILQPGIEKTRFDVKHFAFIFDYFRLLFSILKKRTISNETFSDPTDPEFEKRSKKILLWYNTELDKKKDHDWNDYFEGNVFFPIYNFIQTNFILTEEEFERRYKELEQEVLQGNFILTEEEFERRYKELEQEVLPGNFILTEEEFERRYKELEQEVLQGGGNKLKKKKKKYTRLGRAQITKDNKRTSRVIYKSGKGYYIRDVKGIYTLVKKNDVTFA